MRPVLQSQGARILQRGHKISWSSPVRAHGGWRGGACARGARRGGGLRLRRNSYMYWLQYCDLSGPSGPVRARRRDISILARVLTWRHSRLVLCRSVVLPNWDTQKPRGHRHTNARYATQTAGQPSDTRLFVTPSRHDSRHSVPRRPSLPWMRFARFIIAARQILVPPADHKLRKPNCRCTPPERRRQSSRPLFCPFDSAIRPSVGHKSRLAGHQARALAIVGGIARLAAQTADHARDRAH